MKIINLLPKSEQTLIKQEKVFSTVRRAAVYSYISYGLLFAILVGTRFYMQQHLTNLNSLIAQQQEIISKQNNVNLKNAINNDNSTIQDYLNLAKNNPTWSKVLEAFVKDVPPGVEIQTFKTNTSTGQIQITGVALNRDAVVIQLRQNILNDPLFENIDLPFDNLQQPSNLSFHYTFYVKTNLLKAEPTAKPDPKPKPAAPAAPPQE